MKRDANLRESTENKDSSSNRPFYSSNYKCEYISIFSLTSLLQPYSCIQCDYTVLSKTKHYKELYKRWTKQKNADSRPLKPTGETKASETKSKPFAYNSCSLMMKPDFPPNKLKKVTLEAERVKEGWWDFIFHQPEMGKKTLNWGETDNPRCNVTIIQDHYHHLVVYSEVGNHISAAFFVSISKFRFELLICWTFLAAGFIVFTV